jgi:hypothetical protein
MHLIYLNYKIADSHVLHKFNIKQIFITEKGD